MPKFWTKISYLGKFWAGIWKQQFHIWNEHRRICLIRKLCGKTKIPKFRIKNVSFEYPWLRILKNYCHIRNQHPQIRQNCKIPWENENASIYDQKCLIWVFLGWNLKTILSYLKSAAWNLSNCKILWNNENA